MSQNCLSNEIAQGIKELLTGILRTHRLLIAKQNTTVSLFFSSLPEI